MASTTLNGSFSGSNAPNYAIKIDLTSTSNGSAANTSNVTAELYMRRTASVAYPQYSLDYSSTVRIVINGSDSGTGKINFDTRSTTDWILLKTYTVNNIAHNADGTKTIAVQGYFEPNATSSLYGGTVSGNFTLDTIPRASSVTVTDANIGDYPTITISRASSSFNHTISWGTGATQPTTTTAIVSHTTATKITTWAIPTSVYALCPNAKSYKYIWIRCDTFFSPSASSYIGTTWAKCTAYVDEATNKPNLSVEWANTDLSPYTGDTEKLVRYKSSVTATATYSANNSATIRAISLSCTDGQTQSSSPATFTNVGGNSFTVSVTDSRGFTTTETKVYPIVEYITPSVNAVATRPQPTTGEVRLEISGLYFNGTFGAQTNTATLQYRYKSIAAWSEWVTVTPTLTGNSYSYNGVLAETYDYQTSFDFEVRLTDKLNAIVNTASVSRGIPVFDWGENDFNFNVPIKLVGIDLFDKLYPVGSIYISANNVNPSTLFGGTWEQIKDKFLLSAGDTYQGGSTGGSADAVVVSHYHRGIYALDNSSWEFSSGLGLGGTHLMPYAVAPSVSDKYNYTSGGLQTGAATNGQSGTGKNMPPYLAVYVWKRTA